MSASRNSAQRRNSAAAPAARRAPGTPRERKLQDLWSVGPAIQDDLESLGVHTVAQLARRRPERLYRDLERVTGRKQDPCVLDTFRAAVAQAVDPDLPTERCVWWYWSRLRKKEEGRQKTVGGRRKKIEERSEGRR